MRLRILPFSGEETPTADLIGHRQTESHLAMGSLVIQAYALRTGRIERSDIGKETPLAGDAVWLDIVQPTPEERSCS